MAAVTSSFPSNDARRRAVAIGLRVALMASMIALLVISVESPETPKALAAAVFDVVVDLWSTSRTTVSAFFGGAGLTLFCVALTRSNRRPGE